MEALDIKKQTVLFSKYILPKRGSEVNFEILNCQLNDAYQEKLIEYRLVNCTQFWRQVLSQKIDHFPSIRVFLPN